MRDNPREKLSEEALESMFAYVRRGVESGEGGPHYRNSLLGLWTMVGNFINLPDNLFAIHVGLRDEETTYRESGIPFEFVPVSLNVLDAYTTSVLSADVFIPDEKEIIFSISLDRGETVPPSIREASDLWVSLSAFSREEPCIATSRCHLDLLPSLSATLATKEMQYGMQTRQWRPDLAALTSLKDCVIRMPYPGKMLAMKTYYLVHHTIEEWPRATLRFPVAKELRHRARKVVDFLLNDPSSSACEA